MAQKPLLEKEGQDIAKKTGNPAQEESPHEEKKEPSPPIEWSGSGEWDT